MFDTLLESRHTPLGLPRWGVAVAIGLHAAAVGAIIRPAPPPAASPVVIPGELPSIPDQSVLRKTTGPELVVSGSVDIDLSPIPPLQPIRGVLDVDQPSTGIPGGNTGVPAIPFGTEDTMPLLPSLVQEPPELLTAPVPPYPPLLRAAGMAGAVTVQVVVDTSGRPEPASLRVVQSSNAGFDAAAVATIRGALFRPGRVWGRAVRVLVQVPVAFRLHP